MNYAKIYADSFKNLSYGLGAFFLVFKATNYDWIALYLLFVCAVGAIGRPLIKFIEGK